MRWAEVAPRVWRVARGKGGVGLGHAIVETIAGAHGGRSSVQSSASGSTFTLVLPGFRSATPVPAPTGSGRAGLPQATGSLDGEPPSSA